MSVTGKKSTLYKVVSVFLALVMVSGSMVSGNWQNTTYAEEIVEHHYNNKGFCTDEGCEQPYQKPEGDGSSGHPFEIEKAGELYYFAGIVNGDDKVCKDGVSKNVNAYAKLTEDIVINEGTVNTQSDSLRQWQPIGSSEYYTGTFDGCGYTISGLYCDKGDSTNGALINQFQGTLQNVGLINSYIAGKNTIASFVVEHRGTIENCYSTATLQCTEDSYVAGIASNSCASYAKTKNCYFAGQFQGGNNTTLGFRGIVAGNLSGAGTSTPYYSAYGSVENCYYLSGDRVKKCIGDETAVTAGQMSSGYVAYALNGDQKTLIYGQALSGPGVSAGEVQTTPVLGGNPVYEVMKKECPGIEDTDASVEHKIGYTNDRTQIYRYEYPDHNYPSDNDNQGYSCVCQQCGKIKEHEHVFEKNICKLCGSYEEAEGKGTKEEPYRIGNASQLCWFATKANEEGSSFQNANVILTDEIYLNPEGVTAGSVNAYSWDMIDEYPEGAVFDGQGHSIHGLCYKGSDEYGFIGQNNGTITNLVITGVSVEVSGEYEKYGTVCVYNSGTIEKVSVGGQIMGTNTQSVGGICDRNQSSGTIRNCNNYCNMTAERYAGGIANDNDNLIEECCNYGNVVSSGSYIGGIAGSSDEGLITRSVNYATVTGNGADSVCVGGICGYETSESEISLCVNMGSVTGARCVGGICGVMYDSQIENCYNRADITAMNMNAGGIAGDVSDSTVSYCFSTGTIQAGTKCKHRYAGGILGEWDGESNLERCYYDTSGIAIGTGFGCMDCGIYESVVKDYNEAEGIEAAETSVFAQVRMVWTLNQAADETWLYLTEDGKIVLKSSGIDGYAPVRNAFFGCSGSKTPISEEFVQGESDSNTYKYRVHNYDATTFACTECGKVLSHLCIYGEDGYCKFCHKMRVPDGDGTKESPYEISNAAELYWFAGVVNGDKDICIDGIEKNPEACAVLTDDIVLNEGLLSAETTQAAVWTPIGVVSEDDWDEEAGENSYKGYFDGQGHTVSGVYIPYDINDSNGFFGNAGVYSEIKNLNLENVYICGSEYAGGICSLTQGKIVNCSVSGTIQAEDTDGVAGGIVGIVFRDGKIYGCHNMARITAESAGSIVGWMYDESIVVGCYDTVGYTDENITGIAGTCKYPALVTGCYYLSDVTPEAVIEGYNMSEEDFSSGRVTYRMNRLLEEASLEAGYGQILTGEKAQKFPVWQEKTKVYAIGEAKCPGAGVDSVTGFSNDRSHITYTYPEHQYENGSVRCTWCGEIKEHTCDYTDGYCKLCSSMSKPEGDGTKESPYQISTAGELFWFRSKVSGDLEGETANPAACAVLTQNIDTQAYTKLSEVGIEYWTPFGVSEKTGTSRAYMGTFDGQNHIISGVAVAVDSSSGQKLGLFGQIGTDGVVMNLQVRDSGQSLSNENKTSMLSVKERSVGMFCNSNQGIISACSVNVEFEAENVDTKYFVAGFAGENRGTIQNCSVSGELDGKSDSENYMAGICSYNYGTLKGCTNEAAVDGCHDAAGVCIYNYGTIEECSNRGDIYSYVTKTSHT